MFVHTVARFGGLKEAQREDPSMHVWGHGNNGGHVKIVSVSPREVAPMSVRTCLASKPPLVCFVVSLFLMALSVFALALSIQFGVHIRNQDALGWNDFLAKITQLEFCVDPASAGPTAGPSTGKPNSTAAALSTISLFVPISASLLESFQVTPDPALGSGPFLAHGDIALGSLHRIQPQYSAMVAEVSFWLPAQSVGPLMENTIQDICMTVTAPVQLIRDLNSGDRPNRNCSLPGVEDSPRSGVQFHTHGPDRLPGDWCLNGTQLTITYESHPEWVVLINETDRDIIDLHMFCTSAFLFAIACSVIFIIFVRGWQANRTITRASGDELGHRSLLKTMDDF
ncbi:hypothetical protein TCAL_15098 [Tigriopus californicus]|uniref:TMEM248/TMEM219 domain-containing protein n=1 Tax=Tigriopus californicus TaxID=6832 RepID=A0A553NSN4_TIGCA|nr:hypothetical protein TCAL_15098 [Tigriopus californicus]